MPDDQLVDPVSPTSNNSTVFGNLIHGDNVGGDKVGRDKISVSGKGNAVGPGAIANYYEVQVNMPPALVAQLLAASEQERQEDYGRSNLEHDEPWEPETVLVPAGPFLMGSEPGDGIPAWETPPFTMELPAYRIGKYPVTNLQYARFVHDTDGFASELGWLNGNQPTPEQNDLPVSGVSWYEALAYCAWLIEKTGRPYTLPSEAQWEKAARGTQGQLFPWGKDWQDGKYCNVNGKEITGKSAFPGGESPFHCLDMVGNVREWTTTLWGRHRRLSSTLLSQYPWDLPWKPNEGVDKLDVNRQIRRVTRGGAALVAGVELRASRRSSELPYRRGLTGSRIGFRVALNWEE